MVKATPVRPTESSGVGTSEKELRRMWGIEDADEEQNNGTNGDEFVQSNFEEHFDEEDKRIEVNRAKQVMHR